MNNDNNTQVAKSGLELIKLSTFGMSVNKF